VSDDLNAKATVEVDFIANGLTQLITGIGQLNEAQGFQNKANVQLEQGLTKVATQYGINSGAARTVATATTGTAAASNAAAAATQKHQTSLIATRYALYDVSNAMGIAGAALTGFAAIAYKTAIDYQSEFAAVTRTTGLTGVAAQQLEANLIGISQALPASFKDISSVAALGGQLGIANSQLLDFTTNVIKFAATTNVSVDASATAFGRLNALLPDVQGNYNGLGSSILKVGINSVATESQIITIASRIAGIGASAGLTSDQVIGLSGALASLGVQPYGASGTVTRLFTKIETAVSQGGTALEAFGAVSGKTGAEFQAAWGADKTTTLEALFSGINAQGPGAIEAIKSLGLTSAQDLPNLLKLSQNVDLVKSSLDDAATGMKDGTQLTKSYGIISDTVAAKIKILGNNFSALENAIGKSGAGIGGFLDVANGLLEVITKISEDPVGATFLGIGVAVVGLAGIVALGAAGFLRLAATAAAVTTANGAAAGSGGIFAAALNILTGATGRAAASQGALAAATGVADVALVTETTAATTASIALGVAVDALKALSIVGAVFIATDIAGHLLQSADQATGFAASLDSAGKALDSFNKKQITKDLGLDANNGVSIAFGSLAGRAKNPGVASGQDFNNSIGNVTGLGDTANSISYYDKQLSAFVSSGASKQAAAEFKFISDAAIKQGATLKQVQAQFPQYEAALKATGKASKSAADDQAAETQAVSDALSASSDALDATLKQENALYSLGDSLGQTGDDFSVYSAAGRTNLADLEAVVSAVASQTAGDAQATADNLQGLFNALTQGAHLPAAALTFLSDSIANLGVKAIQPTTFDLTSLNQGLGDGMTTAAAKATKAANSAAKAVYTLVNYGSDLGTVFSRAFDLRFSNQTSLDAVTTAWSNIKQAASDAADAELKAQATLDGLTSDRAVDEYYLKVANAYGDTLRASQIQAELAQNASDTADANKALATAQDATNKTLVGNSDAAIANRSTITGLITDYETYIQTLASSGLSTDKLKQKVAQAKQGFIDQATALGFSKPAIQNYAKAFDDMAVAINGVPRKITVSANADPATQALKEFLANAKSTIGKGISVPITTSANSSAANALKKAEDQVAWKAFLASNIQAASSFGAAPITASRIATLKREFTAATGITDGFADGGYTGDGGKYQPAGIVHAGEFVFSKEATSRIGVNNLAYAHSQATRGYADGGYVGGSSSTAPGYTQLAPFDRQLLVDIRQAIDRNQISPSTIASLGQAQATRNSNRRAS
jgi:TP901 family phage tail tape measure protein